MSENTSSTLSVCVIIAAYNASATIARAISSALAEPEVTEVIVVDDASTDNTATIARSLDDRKNRLKVLVQEKNSGPAAARNRALLETRADWVCVLDSDDFFMPGRINGLLSQSGGVDFVADDMWQVPENNINAPRIRLMGDTLTQPKTITFEEFVLSNVTRRGHNRKELGFIKPLMRRQFLEHHKLAYKENMRLGEDYEFYARALGLGATMILIPAQGYVSVVRANSLSGNHTEADLLHLRNCDLDLIKELKLSPTEQQALQQHYISMDCRLQWRLLILAVKQKNIRGIIATFIKPIPVVIYLLRHLLLEVAFRGLKLKR